jgi:23S rRNA (pseudouridine1915-N3)-methyltransferase
MISEEGSAWEYTSSVISIQEKQNMTNNLAIFIFFSKLLFLIIPIFAETEKPDRMKIRFIVIGKTDDSYLKTGISEYITRLKHYITVEYTEIPALKKSSSLSMQEQQAREKDLIEKNLKPGETVVLLDEHGKQMTSTDLALYLNQKMVSGIKSLVFLVGGPYGFHTDLIKKKFEMISLSKMTFSHQMVRLVFAEQLYRAFTILRNESYHHE